MLCKKLEQPTFYVNTLTKMLLVVLHESTSVQKLVAQKKTFLCTVFKIINIIILALLFADLLLQRKDEWIHCCQLSPKSQTTPYPF